jgi:hypothetical protein
MNIPWRLVSTLGIFIILITMVSTQYSFGDVDPIGTVITYAATGIFTVLQNVLAFLLPWDIDVQGTLEGMASSGLFLAIYDFAMNVGEVAATFFDWITFWN